MFYLLAFMLGLLAGVVTKGININVVHKSVHTVDKPVQYNESMASALPPEVQEYYNTTNGFNRF